MAKIRERSVPRLERLSLLAGDGMCRSRDQGRYDGRSMPNVSSGFRTARKSLFSLLGQRLSTSEYDLESHARDESFHPPAPPDAVAFPLSNQEVASIVRICREHSVPIIPFGAGTAVEGHVQATRGGVSLDLSRMDRILDLQPDDLDCRVQAGIRRIALNDQLEKHGMWLPVDPGADASIGGMAATGASGTTTVRYGTIRENVLGLTCVMADGRILHTGGRARKSSAGYDLTKLMLGSEGTLGVITEVQLKLNPLPEAVSAAVCSFPDIGGCVEAVIEILQSGIPVARCELLDEISMRAVSSYAKLSYEPAPTMFFEFHGTPASVAEQAEQSGEIAAEHGGGDFHWTREREKRERLWHARHHAYYAIKALRPGSYGWVSDVCVPISKLADSIVATQRDVEEARLTAPILGHVGDGNFHAIFLVDPEDEDEMGRATRANKLMVERALAMGGTCTGEHGIGIGKREALIAQHGVGVGVMRLLKKALDPDGILNPDKILAWD